MNEENPPHSETQKREQRIREFWRANNIFKKSLEKKAPKGEFVFYDGPPFATGLPHYGHILAGIIKDAVPRYRTMQGFRVPRRWGWDCHGLPVETLIEKERNLQTKKDIEEMGIAEFNRLARESVLRYADDWREIIPKTGRWADMERDYRTMDWTYTESVWWVFKTLNEKKLIYEGFKSMHLCPRCETTLSNFEVSQGYAEVTDFAVTVALPLKNDPTTALLIWTTTPWTLPGNMAAAVHNDIVYGRFQVSGFRFQYIVAKERAADIFKEHDYELVEELKGSDLVGKSYEPPFDYYKDAGISNKENAWKVYAAPYVTTGEGTGIVHLAPAFGEEDLVLAQEKNIPVVHHVQMDGTFAPEVRDFAGMPVKKKGDTTSADIEIIKNLAHRGLLFEKEKITHSYPLCWRCDTPLLNYAATSWFVEVDKIKDKLIAANKKIQWTPREIRDGRFGKWLENVRDWAISRARFWGAPLPLWRCDSCSETAAIGSVEELKQRQEVHLPLYMMRHGQAESNVTKQIDATGRADNHLTEKGAADVRTATADLKNAGICRIYVSPLVRTRETAEIVAEELGLGADAIVVDERIQETQVGIYDGRPVEEFHAHFKSTEEWFDTPVPEGESLADMKKRMGDFLYDVAGKHKNEPILVVSHSDPIWALVAAARGKTRAEMLAMEDGKSSYIKTAEARSFTFVPLPHDEEYQLDLHRPYIDAITFPCGSCEGQMTRVQDVFDCWFESGSMPYGQYHYPFEGTDIFNPRKNKGFPADFIAEGLDQTRGWFYSMLVLSVALFGKAAYKNVVVNGLVLAEDGRKMSKRLGNYPDPVHIMDTYGADAMRLYLLSSSVVRAEDLRFSEDGVKDMQNKVVRRFWNTCSFYLLNADESVKRLVPKSSNVLDQWIRTRLAEATNKVTDAMDAYELDRAVRPVASFIDDFSTWYVRRSRERFKSDPEAGFADGVRDEKDRADAIATTRFILLETAKLIAPFAPFIAEDVYQNVKQERDTESVHLSRWPKRAAHIPVWPNPKALLHRIFGTHRDFRVLSEMDETRRIVSQALEARARAGIKVRQPLAALYVKSSRSPIRSKEEYLGLIRDEVNVKSVLFDDTIEDDVALDTTITDALSMEGEYRELARAVQALRKENGLEKGDLATLSVSANNAGKKILEKYGEELKKTSSLERIDIKEGVTGEDIQTGRASFTLALESISK